MVEEDFHAVREDEHIRTSEQGGGRLLVPSYIGMNSSSVAVPSVIESKHMDLS